MIIQFSVSNYLSFKELSTLSLLTTNLKEAAIADTDSMTEMGDAIPAILHGAAIYGANASGKSNYAKAFSTFKWLVVNSMKELKLVKQWMWRVLCLTRQQLKSHLYSK